MEAIYNKLHSPERPRSLSLSHSLINCEEKEESLPLMAETNKFFLELEKGEIIQSIQLTIYTQSNYIKWISLLLIVIEYYELGSYFIYISLDNWGI